MRTPTDELDSTALKGALPKTAKSARSGQLADATPLPEARPIQQPQPQVGSSPDSPPDPQAIPSRSRQLFGQLLADSPSWLTSMAVHMAALLVLALWYLPELPAMTAGLLESLPSDTEQADDIAELEPLELDPSKLEDLPEALEVQPHTTTVADSVDFTDAQDLSAPPSLTELADFGLDTAPQMLSDHLGPIGTSGLTGRGEVSRTALVRRGGGNEATEIAVAMALKWLADHQNSDGS